MFKRNKKEKAKPITLEEYDVSPLNDLPLGCREVLHEAKIPPTEAIQHYEVLVSCLYFQLRKEEEFKTVLRDVLRSLRKKTTTGGSSESGQEQAQGENGVKIKRSNTSPPSLLEASSSEQIRGRSKSEHDLTGGEDPATKDQIVGRSEGEEEPTDEIERGNKKDKKKKGSALKKKKKEKKDKKGSATPNLEKRNLEKEGLSPRLRRNTTANLLRGEAEQALNGEPEVRTKARSKTEKYLSIKQKKKLRSGLEGMDEGVDTNEENEPNEAGQEEQERKTKKWLSKKRSGSSGTTPDNGSFNVSKKKDKQKTKGDPKGSVIAATEKRKSIKRAGGEEDPKAGQENSTSEKSVRTTEGEAIKSIGSTGVNKKKDTLDGEVHAARSTIVVGKYELSKEEEELFQKDNPTNYYAKKAEIASGGFGTVWTAKDKIQNRTVAVKILKKGLAEDPKGIINEIQMLKSCQHPNIVAYLDTFLWEEKIWMVMEYCNGGSLRALIQGTNLPEGHMSNICGQMLRGLHYLHKDNRVHRDIKSDNVLLNMDGVVKLADLGLCAEMSEEEDTVGGIAGSRYWMAPEVIQRKPYNCKADIWSLGAVLMEMMEKKPPYYNQHSLKAMFDTATKGAPSLKNQSKYSTKLLDFLSLCCTFDPEKRPSAEELLKHPFITEKANSNQKLTHSIHTVFLNNAMQSIGF
ncbi:Protein kinase [Balamuthia mandrillaris]